MHNISSHQDPFRNFPNIEWGLNKRGVEARQYESYNNPYFFSNPTMDYDLKSFYEQLKSSHKKNELEVVLVEQYLGLPHKFRAEGISRDRSLSEAVNIDLSTLHDPEKLDVNEHPFTQQIVKADPGKLLVKKLIKETDTYLVQNFKKSETWYIEVKSGDALPSLIAINLSKNHPLERLGRKPSSNDYLRAVAHNIIPNTLKQIKKARSPVYKVRDKFLKMIHRAEFDDSANSPSDNLIQNLREIHENWLKPLTGISLFGNSEIWLIKQQLPLLIEALENNKTDEMKQISVEILEAISNLENYDHLKFSNDEALPQEKELIDKK